MSIIRSSNLVTTSPKSRRGQSKKALQPLQNLMQGISRRLPVRAFEGYRSVKALTLMWLVTSAPTQPRICGSFDRPKTETARYRPAQMLFFPSYKRMRLRSARWKSCRRRRFFERCLWTCFSSSLLECHFVYSKRIFDQGSHVFSNKKYAAAMIRQAPLQPTYGKARISENAASSVARISSFNHREDERLTNNVGANSSSADDSLFTGLIGIVLLTKLFASSIE